MSEKLWLMLWERSRRWAQHRLLDEIRAAYECERDPGARRMSLLLDDYMLMERRVREHLACAGVVIHYGPPH